MNIDKLEILFIKATDNWPVWAAWKWKKWIMLIKMHRRGLFVAAVETSLRLSLCTAFAGDRRAGGARPERCGRWKCTRHPRRGINAVESTSMFFFPTPSRNCGHCRLIRTKHVTAHTDALARWAPAAVGGTLRRHRRRAGQLHSDCEFRKLRSNVKNIIGKWIDWFNWFSFTCGSAIYVFVDFQIAAVVQNVDPNSGFAGELCFFDSMWHTGQWVIHLLLYRLFLSSGPRAGFSSELLKKTISFHSVMCLKGRSRPI